ncbi:hypothetical protein UY286_04830 [Paenibacillus polymyxa]|uniref:hypothetical protein n=1 Tax=Paenibacillus polymyxa TaxID=1406 RepID=UPI002AB55C41|nr:hypothetical protein [Paenibacillus polymyxa]MDY7989878.1 hypothetical protein [Paenibacillus polymyxa]MDY8116763.1 hypothetical protein [Paenibacillus polymyxa]
MSQVTFSFTIQGDSEGFVTLECPFCESEFKVSADEFQSEEIPVQDLFCPYCGLTTDKDEFYSKETVEHINALATNYMYEEINKTFGEIAKVFNRNKSIVKMDFKPLKKVNVQELKDKDTVEEIFVCTSCDKREKVLFLAGASKVYCAYCGVDL